MSKCRPSLHGVALLPHYSSGPKSNVRYTIFCDESYGGRNVKVSWKLVTALLSGFCSQSNIDFLFQEFVDDPTFKSEVYVRNHYQNERSQLSVVQQLDEERTSKSAKLAEKVKIFLYQAFLPQGFPHSVSNDYVEYQVWDTMQAFSSTLTSVLTTHAIMLGVGVGNESASALAAATAWIIKDGTGMLGRIMFAWWEGTILDADCKRWRILADLINDAAMCVELLLPFFPQSCVVYLLALSSLGKSLVGVAGGATRASITQHQAITGNIGDVAAKDGSQETFVNLTASLLGLAMLKLSAGSVLITWILFLILTGIHIYSNYRAVSCLEFNSLNRQRFIILFRHYLQTKEILSASAVREQEHILCPLTERQVFYKHLHLGSSLSQLEPDQYTCITKYKELFILSEHLKSGKMHILLSSQADVKAILKAYCFSIFYDIKKNPSSAVSLFQKEIKYENDEEAFKESYFEEFFYKLIGSRSWDLSHLNHFQIDEWRYHNTSLSIQKEKTN